MPIRNLFCTGALFVTCGLASVVSADEFTPYEFRCETQSHHFLLEQVGPKVVLLGWPKSKPKEVVPELAIPDGSLFKESSTGCIEDLWRFTNGKDSYEVRLNQVCKPDLSAAAKASILIQRPGFPVTKESCLGEGRQHRERPERKDTRLYRRLTCGPYLINVDPALDGGIGPAYRSWKRPKTVESTPDIIIWGDEDTYHYEGGSIGYDMSSLKFHKGDFSYTIIDGREGGMDETAYDLIVSSGQKEFKFACSVRADVPARFEDGFDCGDHLHFSPPVDPKFPKIKNERYGFQVFALGIGFGSNFSTPGECHADVLAFYESYAKTSSLFFPNLSKRSSCSVAEAGEILNILPDGGTDRTICPGMQPK